MTRALPDPAAVVAAAGVAAAAGAGLVVTAAVGAGTVGDTTCGVAAAAGVVGWAAAASAGATGRIRSRRVDLVGLARGKALSVRCSATPRGVAPAAALASSNHAGSLG
ncbi:MAG: hypothetical protein ACPGUV_09355 [Polyangiales bacterium]